METPISVNFALKTTWNNLVNRIIENEKKINEKRKKRKIFFIISLKKKFE